jgi:hypothetical protein
MVAFLPFLPWDASFKRFCHSPDPVILFMMELIAGFVEAFYLDIHAAF